MMVQHRKVHMVVVAQLVEHRVVVPGVAGSSPVGHPKLEVKLSALRGAQLFCWCVRPDTAARIGNYVLSNRKRT